ncbi:hypothetical protein [Bosea lathyri]|uniref:hypothetical protein n=1 Tax=Bosea lathyri TaxID=1036778 RepID=UPI000CDEDFB9|nr:hypothetical protein [Bosea lathyri]
MKPVPPLIVIHDDSELALAERRVEELQGAKKGSAAHAERLGWAAAIRAYEGQQRGASKALLGDASRRPLALWNALIIGSIAIAALALVALCCAAFLRAI